MFLASFGARKDFADIENLQKDYCHLHLVRYKHEVDSNSSDRDRDRDKGKGSKMVLQETYEWLPKNQRAPLHLNQTRTRTQSCHLHCSTQPLCGVFFWDEGLEEVVCELPCGFLFEELCCF